MISAIIKKNIQNGDTNEAIDLLISFLEMRDNDLYNQSILCKSRFSTYKSDKSKNVIPNPELILSQINNTILEIVDEVIYRKLEFKKDIKLKKIKLFISYSHKDEALKEKIDIALSALKRSNKISTWNDRKIIPGTEWDEKINNELEEANVILLLVSADFIASDYIWDVEIKKAIERHERKEAIIIPVFCRYCDFSDMPFSKIQGLPNDARPLNSFENFDEGLTIIAKGIREIVDSFEI